MSDTYILENDELRAVVSADGAQLISLRDKRTEEPILWEGDPAYWRDSAPWLFPIIGQLKDGRFLYGGREWRTPMHGFAKRMTFQPDLIGPESMTFTLACSEETLKIYPWKFDLNIRYTLSGRTLSARCEVLNRDTDTMYYSLGAHPGFTCQAGDQLELGADEITYRRLYAENHLMRKENQVMKLDGGRMTLKNTLFQDDAMLVEAPEMTRIALHKQKGADVVFTYDRVPWLGLWTRFIPTGEVKYICLEPWQGVDDICDADGQIEHKVAINALETGKTGVFNMSIEVM